MPSKPTTKISDKASAMRCRRLSGADSRRCQTCESTPIAIEAASGSRCTCLAISQSQLPADGGFANSSFNQPS
jgi:hypothetical protein